METLEIFLLSQLDIFRVKQNETRLAKREQREFNHAATQQCDDHSTFSMSIVGVLSQAKGCEITAA